MTRPLRRVVKRWLNSYNYGNECAYITGNSRRPRGALDRLPAGVRVEHAPERVIRYSAERNEWYDEPDSDDLARLTPLDTTDESLAQLDWIGAFSAQKCIEVETHLMPVIRCLEFQNGNRRCVNVARSRCEHLVRRLTLTKLRDVTLSGLHGLVGATGPYGAPDDPRVAAMRPHVQPYNSRIFISDDNSEAVPFANLKRSDAALADFVSGFSQCPDTVSFFIVREEATTHIFQTGSILQACYLPAALDTHLHTAEPEAGLNNKLTMFDGFRYTPLAKRHFPFRAARNLARAQHEVNQILPRAAAYFRRNRTFLPLLVRPPFVGNANVRGLTFVYDRDCRRTVLFPAAIDFYSAVEDRVFKTIAERRRSLEYAPRLYLSSGLSNAGGLSLRPWSEPPFREPDAESAHDTRFFRHVEREVAMRICCDRMRGKAAPKTVQGIVDLRDWCARSIEATAAVPPPASWSFGDG